MNSNALLGSTLGGRYRLEELLGQGGMSAVYRAVDPNLRRRVAVKLIHSHLSNQPEFLRRFEEEAAAVASLRHPNIIQVYDFNHDQGTYYMVMEYVAGETLQDRLKKLNESSGRLAFADVVRYAAGVCDAVDYANRLGMIHRDIKPANIMLDENGQAILMDFGIAKIVGGQKHTLTGAVVGTALYMSPEQIRGDVLDGRSDIYSLGVTLFEMVSGRPPFESDSTMSLMMMHLTDPVPDLRALRPGVPDGLASIIEKALGKTPAERFGSAAEMAAALRREAANQFGKTGAAGEVVQVFQPTVRQSPSAAPEPPARTTGVGAADSSALPTVAVDKSSLNAAAAEMAAAVPQAHYPAGQTPPPYGANPAPPFGAGQTPAYGSGQAPAYGAGQTPPYGAGPTPAYAPGQTPPLPMRQTGSAPAARPGGRRAYAAGGCALLVGIMVCVAVVGWLAFRRGLLVSRSRAALAPYQATQTAIAATSTALNLMVNLATQASPAALAATPAATAAPVDNLPTPTSAQAAPAAPAAPAPTLQVTRSAVSVLLVSIRLEGEEYVVEYETTGFLEKAGSRHIHFFFNTEAPDSMTNPDASYVMWPGPRPFRGLTIQDLPEGAAQICALVATAQHETIPGSGNCIDLPVFSGPTPTPGPAAGTDKPPKDEPNY
ncbi:MAG: serine/threonine protein kinase [Chloroflexota bacterium]